jgi:hypothetical protein
MANELPEDNKSLYSDVIIKLSTDIVQEDFHDLVRLLEVIPDQALKNYVDGKPQCK